jgi:hypothetical protein
MNKQSVSSNIVIVQYITMTVQALNIGRTNFSVDDLVKISCLQLWPVL